MNVSFSVDTISLPHVILAYFSVFYQKAYYRTSTQNETLGPGENRRFWVLKGLQIFSVFLLLEWADSPPNTHLSAMKPLGGFSVSDATFNTNSFPSGI